MKEMRRVITEKHLFDGRVVYFVKNFEENLNKQDFEARVINKTFPIEFSCEGVKLLIESLLEEIKPVVLEKHEVKDRHKSEKDFFKV